MGELIIAAVLCGTVVAASVTDLRTRRIPNVLTAGAAAVGLAMNGLVSGPDGLVLSLQGWLVGIALLFPLFVFRAVGAGDVKLMAAVGALGGAELVFFAALWGAVVGGAMALFGLARSGRLRLALMNIYYFKALPGPRGGSFITAARLPYGPAIAAGALLALGGVRWLPI